MRAIIRVKTNVADERLDDILKKKGWLPRITNSDLFENKRKEILATVHQDDIEIVRETILPYVILDDPTKTWGIVNRPVENLVTFRLKNPIPDRLKTAAERLVYDLQSISSEDKDLSFELVSKIEVLEPGGYLHAFSGSVLPKNRFQLAIKRRQSESIVGFASFLAAAVLLVLTMPPLQEKFFTMAVNGAWGPWYLGLFERLATSALVTATVSWLNVMLYWFDLRRLAVIVWEA